MTPENPFLIFYKVYPIDHWLYKLYLLRNASTDYSAAKHLLQKDLLDVSDADYIKMLKVEMRFTYFQMVESLFEMIFALETQDDENLWWHLTTSRWGENYKRINSIAEGRIEFLDRERSLNTVVKIPLLQYIFYFRYSTILSEPQMQENLKLIKNLLVLFARDFSDRGDYNAYKHSLRLYQSPLQISFALNTSNNYQVLGSAEDSFTYLEKEKNGGFTEVTKPFSPKRDFEIGVLCSNLLSNIITSRRHHYFGNQGPCHFFIGIDIQALYALEPVLGKFTVTHLPAQPWPNT